MTPPLLPDYLTRLGMLTANSLNQGQPLQPLPVSGAPRLLGDGSTPQFPPISPDTLNQLQSLPDPKTLSPDTLTRLQPPRLGPDNGPRLLTSPQDSSVPYLLRAPDSNPLTNQSWSAPSSTASPQSSSLPQRLGMSSVDPGTSPTLGGPSMASASLPALTAPDAPQLLRLPTAAQNTAASLLGNQQELQRLQRSGSGIYQITHPVDAQGNPTGQHVGFGRKLLGALANVGQTVESIAAPWAAVATPGTDLHHYVDVGRLQGYVDNDLANQQTEANTALLDARPQLMQGSVDLQNAKLQQTIQHQQDVLDQQKQHQHDTYVANLAQHGYAPDESDPTGQKVRPLRYEEMSENQQAVEDLKHAQAEQADATAAMKKAQNDPTSPAFRLAKQRADVAQQNANTALGRLGLSTSEFAFNQDKFYNPQPTATERTKGDLAQSALERIAEMRQIIAKHPEYFGPIAGRAQNAQAWLGSSDPDAVTYNTAAQYLADHSAGVFGGRGQYITQALHGITDPKYTPQGLNAALDEAQRSAQGFVAAGRPHGRGGTSGYNATPPPANTTPPPQSHVFSVSAWQRANPRGDVNAAIQAAQAQKYQVVH